MKKIVFLNIYNGLVGRGAEIYVSEIAKRLSKKFDVTLVQGGLKKNEPYKIRTIKIPKIISTDVSENLILRILKKFFLDPYSLLVFYFSLRALPILIRQRPDIIVPVNGFWQVIFAKIASFFTSSKIFIHGAAGIGRDDFWNIKLHPDLFMSQSENAALWAKKINPKIKIEIMHAGVDLKMFTSDISPVKLFLERPIIICVCAFVPYKRADLAIKAVAKLKKGSLILLGDGPQKEYLKKLAGDLLGEKRFLIKKVSHNKIASYYNSANLFTLPSEPSEAFGIVYVEAMACGLPVVAPNDLLRQEIVGEAGILTDVGNLDEYAKAIDEVLKRNWDCLPQKQAEKFSWDKISQKYESLIKSFG